MTPEELRDKLYKDMHVTVVMHGLGLQIEGIVGEVLPQTGCVIISLVTISDVRPILLGSE